MRLHRPVPRLPKHTVTKSTGFEEQLIEFLFFCFCKEEDRKTYHTFVSLSFPPRALRRTGVCRRVSRSRDGRAAWGKEAGLHPWAGWLLQGRSGESKENGSEMSAEGDGGAGLHQPLPHRRRWPHRWQQRQTLLLAGHPGHARGGCPLFWYLGVRCTHSTDPSEAPAVCQAVGAQRRTRQPSACSLVHCYGSNDNAEASKLKKKRHFRQG